MIWTLVDSNVLLDVITEDPKWLTWSLSVLEKCALDGPLCINPIIFAEVSIRFATIEELDEALPAAFFRRLDLPIESAFLAGKAYSNYRNRGGTRVSTLPDFFIGAHASISNLRLLTRDAARYRYYFPTIDVICP